MRAIRTNIEDLLHGNIDNLGLRIDKLNAEIDEPLSQGPKSEHRDHMLNLMATYKATASVRESYQYAFSQWKTVTENRGGCISFEICSTTKALIGMGNASVHEFGVSLNRPWGVPYIPGTTLKGLASAYLAKYGGNEWGRNQDDSKKSPFQVQLFGGTLEKKDYIGSVIFNDAWLVPADRQWFVRDIINVHYPSYYRGERLPDGVDNPIPVSIAALAPGLRFWVSLEGDTQEVQFIKDVLRRALSEEGVGGKTAVGYGRFEVLASQDEVLQNLIAQITSASNEELLQLNQSHGRNDALRSAFELEAENRPLNSDLCDLYQRFTPLKTVVLKINAGEIGSQEDLRHCYRQVEANIRRYDQFHLDCPLNQTADAQEIFRYALDKLNVTANDIQIHALLRRIAYSWIDMGLTEENIVDRIMDLKPDQSWPPLSTLEEFIRTSGFNEEVKAEALEALQLVLGQ